MDKSKVKINKIEVICLQDPAAGHFRFEGSYQNAVVLVHGSNGMIGIGETDSPPSVVRAIIEMPTYNSLAIGLKELLVGQVIDDPKRLWVEMYRATQWIGRHGVTLHAISALDIAIWDLFAKSAGKSVCDMLGVKRHDRLPVYASLYPMNITTDEITRQVEPLMAKGFKGFKFFVDPWWSDIELVHKNLRHLRKLVGANRTLMFDVAQEFNTLDQLKPFIKLLEEIGVAWIEAPFPIDNLADHIALKRCTSLPLTIGDLGLTTCKEFMPFIKANAIDIAQPDLTMFGGLTEALKLAKLVEDLGLRIVPHAYNTDVVIAANIHFAATLSSPSWIEYSTSPSRLRRELCFGLPTVDTDGMIAIPVGNGLGITLNNDLIAELRMN
jgi:L-alanine-DL-glutamate epimerase-like enolase superfamily enzyme